MITNTGQLNGKTLPGAWQRLQFTWVACAVPKPQPNISSLGWDGLGCSQHDCTAVQSAATAWSIASSWTNIPVEHFQNLVECPCRMPWRIQPGGKGGIRPCTRWVYLINCACLSGPCPSVCYLLRLLIVYFYVPKLNRKNTGSSYQTPTQIKVIWNRYYNTTIHVLTVVFQSAIPWRQ